MLQTFILNKDFIHSVQADGSVIAFNMIDEENAYFKFTGLAAKTYLLLIEQKSIQGIKAGILSEDKIFEDQLTAELKNFFDFLKAYGLIYDPEKDHTEEEKDQKVTLQSGGTDSFGTYQIFILEQQDLNFAVFAQAHENVTDNVS